MTIEGITFGFCTNHRAQARNFVVTGDQVVKQNPSPAKIASVPHIEDYTRLKAVMLCRPLFLKIMKDFTNEVSRAEKKSRGIWRTNKEKIKVPLSKSMKYYEALCWFEPQPKVMSGLLTADEFQSAIKNGYMVKDPGPGPDHGEFSHRLQWQYIMRVVTDGFRVARTADWNLSPLQLYCGMGEEGFARNVWGALLEGAGDMVNSPGSPDWVNSQFRSNGSLGQTSFGQSIDARYDKRALLLDEVRQYLAIQGVAEIHVVATQVPKANSENVHKIVEFLYKWRLVGPPVWVGGAAPLNTSPIEVRAAEIWAANIGNRFAPGGRGYLKARNADNSVSEGLLLHGSELVIEAMPLDQRLVASQGALNTGAYRYSSTTGAELR